MNSLASDASLKDFHLAVGIWCLSKNAFAQLLSDSNLAASLQGPNTLMLDFSRKSEMPLAKGSSGPTITTAI